MMHRRLAPQMTATTDRIRNVRHTLVASFLWLVGSRTRSRSRLVSTPREVQVPDHALRFHLPGWHRLYQMLTRVELRRTHAHLRILGRRTAFDLFQHPKIGHGARSCYVFGQPDADPTPHATHAVRALRLTAQHEPQTKTRRKRGPIPTITGQKRQTRARREV